MSTVQNQSLDLSAKYASLKSPHQWVDGRSAKEVACAWPVGNGSALPSEIFDIRVKVIMKKFACPKCKAVLALDENFQGTVVLCQTCKTSIKVSRPLIPPAIPPAIQKAPDVPNSFEIPPPLPSELKFRFSKFHFKLATFLAIIFVLVLSAWLFFSESSNKNLALSNPGATSSKGTGLNDPSEIKQNNNKNPDSDLKGKSWANSKGFTRKILAAPSDLLKNYAYNTGGIINLKGAVANYEPGSVGDLLQAISLFVGKNLQGSRLKEIGDDFASPGPINTQYATWVAIFGLPDDNKKWSINCTDGVVRFVGMTVPRDNLVVVYNVHWGNFIKEFCLSK